MNKFAIVKGMCMNNTRVLVTMEESGDVKSYLEEELSSLHRTLSLTPPPQSPTFRRKRSEHFNVLMGKRLDASIDKVFSADKVKYWRQRCGATQAELCESAVRPRIVSRLALKHATYFLTLENRSF